MAFAVLFRISLVVRGVFAVLERMRLRRPAAADHGAPREPVARAAQVAGRRRRLLSACASALGVLECELCGKRGRERSTCEPLLVSGEVIGAVLVQHAGPLAPDQKSRIKNSVVQAAPVRANLRNLAIAELRASTDALTGLPNNRALQGNMKRMVALAARTETSLAVVALDLDHFKQINDTYGHGKGDEVLAAVGAVLQSTTRESGFVGRWGGEEFMLLLPDVDREGALAAAEKVRRALVRVTVAGVDQAVTASLGIAAFPDDGLDVTTLARNADRALYTAKANGRDRVEAFTAESRSGIALEA